MKKLIIATLAIAAAAMAQNCNEIKQERVNKWFRMCGTESLKQTIKNDGDTMVLDYKMDKWQGYKVVKINGEVAMGMTAYGYNNGKVCFTLEAGGRSQYGCLDATQMLYEYCTETYRKYGPYFGIAKGQCD